MTAQELKQLITDFWRETATNGKINGADLENVGHEIVDFISESVENSNIPVWAAGLTFQTDGTDDGSFCTYPDANGKLRFWKTKTDDNIGNAPPADPEVDENADWIEVSPSSSSSIKEWEVGLYGSGLIIVYHNHSVDGRGLYILLNPVRPYDSANIETEISAGDWARITGGVQLRTVDTTGAINLNLENQPDMMFKGSDIIGADADLTFSNYGFARKFTFRFSTSGDFNLTFQTGTVKMADARWTPGTKKWRSYEAGDFEGVASYDGNEWVVKITEALT